MRTLLSATVLALLAVLAMASPALAHATLTASNPAEGAQVATAPTQLTLTFNEPVSPDQVTITVTGPGGATWQVGAITGTDTTLTAPVQPAGPAGPYTMSYSIQSADEHPVTGAVNFAMTTAVVTTTTPPPTTTEPTTTEPTAPAPAPRAQDTSADDDGIPVWVWIVGAVVVLVAGVAVALGLSRKRGPTKE